MMVGLVLAGMLIGAMAAAVWIGTGGSLLLAFALYGIVAALFVVIGAGAAYLAAARRGLASVAYTLGRTSR